MDKDLFVRNVSKNPVSMPDGIWLEPGSEAMVAAKDVRLIRTLLGGTLIDVEAQPTVTMPRAEEGYVWIQVPAGMREAILDAIKAHAEDNDPV